MRFGQATCMFRGRAFSATYEVSGQGATEAVGVRYKDTALQATTGGLPVEAVAGALLRDLVAWDATSLGTPVPPPPRLARPPMRAGYAEGASWLAVEAQQLPAAIVRC